MPLVVKVNRPKSKVKVSLVPLVSLSRPLTQKTPMDPKDSIGSIDAKDAIDPPCDGYLGACLEPNLTLKKGMRVLLQRIREGKVTVGGEVTGKAGRGLCLYVAVARGDTRDKARYLAEKSMELRVFEDEAGKLNRSILDLRGEILVVSEFTLYGDCTRGRRPSFSQAAPLEEARELYDYFVEKLKDSGLKVETGKFQAKMEVTTVNDGPVTFLLEA